MVYLWRAVDHEGEVLESYVTRSRDKDAALRFMKKALSRRAQSPECILKHQPNRMDEQATMPPPFYRSEDVARTVLAAAENPERDLYVGGTVRFGSALARAFPNVADAAAAILDPSLFKTGQPRDDRPDNLDRPAGPKEVAGDTHGRWSLPSIYTVVWTRLPAGSIVGGSAGGSCRGFAAIEVFGTNEERRRSMPFVRGAVTRKNMP